jgi:hypothetical protein
MRKKFLRGRGEKVKRPNKRTFEERLFDELNERYFRGKLPSFKIARESTRKNSVVSGMGRCQPSKRLITLHPDLGDHLCQTLLHEMCHIETLPKPGYDHGRSFRHQLKNLLLQGENWAAKEIEFYRFRERKYILLRNLRTKFDKEMKDRIDELIVNIEPGVWNWIRARRYLCEEYGINPHKFSRLLPWARDWWRLKLADEQRIEKIKSALRKEFSNEKLKNERSVGHEAAV